VGKGILPRLSIITTTYNDSAGLASTVESIKIISELDLQLIIVDGSTEGSSSTPEIIENAIGAHSNIDVKILYGPDRGIYHAMNKGLMETDGDWIWFMNSGDMFASGAKDFYVETVNSERLWGVGGYIQIDDDGCIRDDIEEELVADLNFNNFIKKKGHWCHQSTIFSTKTIQEFGHYSEEYSFASDFEFTLRLYMKYEPFVYPHRVAVSSWGGASKTSYMVSQFEKNDAIANVLGYSRVRKFFLNLKATISWLVRYRRLNSLGYKWGRIVS
jgi:glycosyltransferase involved in cell wall biosynthesis